MKRAFFTATILTGSKLLFATAFMLLSLDTFAQGPGDGGPTPGNEPPPVDIPIDGGVSFLIAGGAAIGLNKLRKRYKK